MRRQRLLFLATVALLAATLGAAAVIGKRQRPFTLAAPLGSVPTRIAGWTGSDDPPFAAEVLQQLNANEVLSRTYRRDGAVANLFVAFYARQRANESMHAPKSCLPGNGWAMWGDSSAQITVAGRPIQVSRYAIQRNGERMLALYWYQSRRHVASNEYIGKWYLIRDAILEGDTAGAIVRFIVHDRPDAVPAVETLATAVIPALERCMQAGRPPNY